MYTCFPSNSHPTMELMRLMTAAVLLLAIAVVSAPAISVDAATHYFTFNVSDTTVFRACTTTVIPTINGEFPGPIIRVQEGDTVVVYVNHESPLVHSLSIHWHGLPQVSNSWMDGAQWITQCPIWSASGQVFIYNFTVAGQYGTLWWHADGSFFRSTIYGALVVEPAQPKYSYDDDIVLLLGEWWTKSSVELEAESRAAGASPVPSDAYTINGIIGADNTCGEARHTTEVYPGKTYLLRIVNTALVSHLFFKIAGHTFTVVAVDGSYTSYTAPFTTDIIVLAPGQSVDALMVTNAPPGLYEIVVQRYQSTGDWASFDTSAAVGSIQYSDAPAGSIPVAPKMPAYTDSALANGWHRALRGARPSRVPQQVNKYITINHMLGHAGPGGPLAGSMNNLAFRIPTEGAILYYEYARLYLNLPAPDWYNRGFPVLPPPTDSYFPVTGKTEIIELNYGDAVEMVLQGKYLFPGPDGSESIHLHGYSFYVVAQGDGLFPGKVPAYNLVDPVKRSTVAVPAYGWVAVRFVADNPGVWLLRSFIEHHYLYGMATAFVVKGPADGRGNLFLDAPSDYRYTCS